MNRMRNLGWMMMALTLSGCVNLGLGGDKDAPEVMYYVLEDAGRDAPAATPAPMTLLMADTDAGTFYDSDGMVFSKQPGTRGNYLYARWSERSGKRFTNLLLSRLEREKIFAAVAQPGSNVRGDWLLTTEILDLYHDAARQPGAVKMELRAEVVDLNTRELLARKTFVQTVAVASYDAEGAYKSFNEATSRMLNDMSDWLRGLAVKR